jgi:hypothetical protein
MEKDLEEEKQNWEEVEKPNLEQQYHAKEAACEVRIAEAEREMASKILLRQFQ